MRPRTAPVPRATRPRAGSQPLRAEHRRLYATPHVSLGYYVARLQSRNWGSSGQALDGGRRDPATNADRHAVLLAPAHNPWNAATGASACAHASAPFLPPVPTTPMSPPTRPLRCSASRARGWARSRGPSPRPSSGEDESYCTPGTSQLLRVWPAGCRRGRPHRVRLDGLALPGIWWAPMSESTRGRGPSRGARRRERATAAKAPAATPVTLTPRTWRLVELLVLATLAILALYAASQDVTGEDLWWHLATGRYILEHGEIPTRDVFSFTYA